MPIRADLKPLYPSDWHEISNRIRFGRAGGRCEACGRPHMRKIVCLPDGRWYDDEIDSWVDSSAAPVAVPELRELHGIRFTRVVLTCAHLNHDPANVDDENLAAWCSRCHLLHDREHHAVQRRITVRLRNAVGDLFSGLYTLAGYPRNEATVEKS